MNVNLTKSLILAGLALSGAAFAQTAAPAAPAPDYTLSYNAGVVTDYRYRGLTQSRQQAAVQGGIDFAHSSGFYLGTWGSSIKWVADTAKANGTGNGTPVEIDFYGGYKGTAGAISYDVGALRYQYFSHDFGPLLPSPNTTELYGAVTYSMFTLKYSHAITNLFGFDDSKNSYYLDLSAAFDLGNGWSLTPHIGYQKVKVDGDYSYTDYSLTLGKDLGNGWSASAALIGTDANKTNYRTINDKFSGKTTVVVGLKYAF
jgi:uncharacterized protein (TIGR02001 family)